MRLTRVMRMLTWMHIIIRDEDNELLVLFCKVYGIIVCVCSLSTLLRRRRVRFVMRTAAQQYTHTWNFHEWPMTPRLYAIIQSSAHLTHTDGERAAAQKYTQRGQNNEIYEQEDSFLLHNGRKITN